jgi:hypothetical protein
MDQTDFDPTGYRPSLKQMKRAEALIDLLRRSDEANAQVSLVGGYGLDALYGQLTRDHHDFDLLVGAESRDAFVKILIDLGYENVPTRSDPRRGKEEYIKRVSEADYEVEFIVFDSAGLAYYAKQFGFRPDWTLFFPREPNGQLLGQPIHAATLEGVEIIDRVQAHTAQELGWGAYKHQEHHAMLLDLLRRRR